MKKHQKIGAIIDHARALKILREAGAEPPVPRDKANTAYLYFQAADGDHMLAVNQTGFAPKADDNEQQTNGLSLLAIVGEVDESKAESILLDAAQEMLEIPRPRGGQPGNQNARAKDGELDGQFLLKLPQTMRDTAAKAAKQTSDRHLSRMLRRLLAEELDRLGINWRKPQSSSPQPPGGGVTP